MNDTNICFIGAGNMAGAIMSGLIKQGISAASITAAEPSLEKLEGLSKSLGVNIESNNPKAVASADVVVLSVKPQVLQQVCEEISPHLPDGVLVISIAAGIEMASIESWLGESVSLVRCMPNTPAQVLEGASGLIANAYANEQQKQIAESMFSSIGLCTWVERESLLHAVTALSGSGPAYIFLVIDAMAKAGVGLGLEEESSKQLAAQTVLGAAKMVLNSELPAEQLKRNVMSPGGTTERAIQVLEEKGVPRLFEQAMQAADKRSAELAELLKG